MKERNRMKDHGAVFSVTDQDFEQQVLSSDLPVIVDFTAEWCPPCKALNPVYAQLSLEYNGVLRFASLDVDEHQQTASTYGIMGMPTLVVFHKGKDVKRFIGPHPTRLKRLIDQALGELRVTADGAAATS